MGTEAYFFFVIAMGNFDCDGLKIVRQIGGKPFERPEIHYAPFDSSSDGEDSSEEEDSSSGVLKSANISG